MQRFQHIDAAQCHGIVGHQQKQEQRNKTKILHCPHSNEGLQVIKIFYVS